MIFHDRVDAGQQLAKALKNYANKTDVLILALPRGGVPVGFEIAKALHLPLDVFLVRKLGAPGEEELAMGAIASSDVEILNTDIIQQLGISQDVINRVKAEQRAILEERNSRYRDNQPLPTIKGKTIILVDDGIATGATMRAAITAIKKLGCKKLILATPLAPASTVHELQHEVDDIVCLTMPEPFYAIGSWYQDFPQTSDEEVSALLTQAHDWIQRK